MHVLIYPILFVEYCPFDFISFLLQLESILSTLANTYLLSILTIHFSFFSPQVQHGFSFAPFFASVSKGLT